MFQIAQHLECVVDNLMRAPPFDISDKTHATSIVLVMWIVKTLFGRCIFQGFSCRGALCGRPPLEFMQGRPRRAAPTNCLDVIKKTLTGVGCQAFTENRNRRDWCDFRLCNHDRRRHRQKLGIRRNTNLSKIQPLDLYPCGNTITNHIPDDLEEHVKRRERECDTNNCPDNLSRELAHAAAIEHSAHTTCHTVQSRAISPISNQPDCNHPHSAA